MERCGYGFPHGGAGIGSRRRRSSVLSKPAVGASSPDRRPRRWPLVSSPVSCARSAAKGNRAGHRVRASCRGPGVRDVPAGMSAFGTKGSRNPPPRSTCERRQGRLPDARAEVSASATALRPCFVSEVVDTTVGRTDLITKPERGRVINAARSDGRQPLDRSPVRLPAGCATATSSRASA